MNLKEKILRFLLKLYYHIKFKFEVKYENFDPNRQDAYFLVGNHPCLQDGIFTPPHLGKYAYPVVNSFEYVHKFIRFLITKVIKSIPIRKGQSDSAAVREMMKEIKAQRPIMLFPEGNSSFFGKEGPIPYSTVKLLKKLKIDVIMLKINGAYMTLPRWGEKATRRGLIEMNFYTLYKGTDLEKMSLEEIYNGLVDNLKFNDYDWNRERKFIYKTKKRALGLENYIYYCPKCKKYQTIYTKGNSVYCTNCGEIASFNQYSFIEGMPFDNLVEWDELQKREVPKIAKDILYSNGILFEADMTDYSKTKYGYVDVELIDNNLFMQNRKHELVFDLEEMIGVVLTKKNELSFDYQGKTFYIVIKDPMIFFDVINYKKGGLFNE